MSPRENGDAPERKATIGESLRSLRYAVASASADLNELSQQIDAPPPGLVEIADLLEELEHRTTNLLFRIHAGTGGDDEVA